MAVFFALMNMFASVATAIGVLLIAFAVTKGLNEHIRAMQAIYQEIVNLNRP